VVVDYFIEEEYFEAVEAKSLCFALPVSLIVVSYDWDEMNFYCCN
jgi:hypothetical protein